MFPQGGPGVALSLLRGSVLASVIAIATRHPGVLAHPLALVGVAGLCLCLAAGFATPVIAFIAVGAAAAEMLIGPHAQGFIVSAVLLLDAAALGLLGPGAYSVDAMLYGRRVTVLPAPTDADR
jgi:hypothetical protein